MIIYAKINSSMQQFGGEKPEGWVKMSSSRPEGNWVASENGEWVPDTLKRIEEIKTLLRENDLASVRPLRAKLAGTSTDYDTTRLLELESEASALRQELESLTNQS